MNIAKEKSYMMQSLPSTKKVLKQRVTAFVDQALVTRAKVRGALEGLTISEVVEKALDAYAPRIEEGKDQHIHLKFASGSAIGVLLPEAPSQTRKIVPKHTKHPGVPR